LKPFSMRAAFKSVYALSIPKLTVRSGNHGTSRFAFSCCEPKKLLLMTRLMFKTSNLPAL
jgi:hypothetical protein